MDVGRVGQAITATVVPRDQVEPPAARCQHGSSRDALLSRVAESIHEMFRCEAAVLAMPNGSGRFDPPRLVAAPHDRAGSVRNWMGSGGLRHMVLPDHHALELVSDTDEGRARSLPEDVTVLLAPVRHGGTTHGVLCLMNGNSRCPRFTTVDATLMGGVADQIGKLLQGKAGNHR